jgi:diaminopimelate epimerase
VSKTTFLATDGVHDARLIDDFIYLEMKDVDDVIESEDSYIADTGSPHYMIFVDRLLECDVLAIGRHIRYNEQYKKDGINVNLIEQKSDLSIGIRTYERGVENETLSCGTGATACALALADKNNLFGKMVIDVDVQGGALKVAFERSTSGNYKAIELIGPAVFVFKGEIDV